VPATPVGLLRRERTTFPPETKPGGMSITSSVRRIHVNCCFLASEKTFCYFICAASFVRNETHTPPYRLQSPRGRPYGRETVAYWSYNPEQKLIVFVHGFKGAAIATWVDFPGQLTLHRPTQGYDMVFFGYDSVTQNAGESANDLHTCTNDLLFKSSEIFNKSAASMAQIYGAHRSLRTIN